VGAQAGENYIKPGKVFKEWADYFVGGVWTTTGAQGREEVRMKWMLDKSFVRLTWKVGDESREEILGIDPATGQWSFWGFDSKGRTWKGIAESHKAGEWHYVFFGQGKDGPLYGKGKEFKLGPDEVRLVTQELIVDGKKQPAETQIWKRTK
jgi:hypothetical protein